MFEHTYRNQSAPATVALPPSPQPIPTPGLADQTNTYATSSPSPTPTRVLIVDDHTVVRNGIAFSLLAFADLDVIAQASTGEEALRLCAETDVLPDVVLMDLIMPGMGGVGAIHALHANYPQVQIVALTSFQEGSLVEEALQAGAIGYLLKDVAVEELAKAIRLAHRGMPILAPAAAQALVHTVVRRPPALGNDLTDREREVL
ncbi:MAG: response regulator, partial [Ktedonobacterales bacterium]